MSIKKIVENKTSHKIPEISVIIPAAGAGKRMKSYGPKSLIKIKKERLIDRQIRIVNEIFPKNTTILVCGFESLKLMNSTSDNLIKIENENYENTNVARSIGMGLRATNSKNVLIVHGDLFFNHSSVNCLNFNRTSTIVTDKMMKKEEVGCVLSEDHFVQHFMYDLPYKWGQMIFLTGNELELYKKHVWNLNNKTIFNFEILNEIINSSGKIKACFNERAIVMDIDNSKDIEKANKINEDY